jgi:ribosomal protein S12 methylthiotransferase accessory factor
MPTMDHDRMAYQLVLTQTDASTGYFACVPQPELDLAKALLYLTQHPLDTFMYRYLLGVLGKMPLAAVQALLQSDVWESLVGKALLQEIALIYPHLSGLIQNPNDLNARVGLADHAPLITLRARGRAGHDIHHTWNQLLAANLSRHQRLPLLDQAPQPLPYDPGAVVDPGGVYITQLLPDFPVSAFPSAIRPSAEETAGLALEKLKGLDMLEGSEMRHLSALSPYGLLHQWRLNVDVKCNRHNYTLSGIQTAYGRGLTLADARASYAMEIVERGASFANISGDHVTGCVQPYSIYHDTRSSLLEKGFLPIDPNEFGIDGPYHDAPLHWIAGRRRTQAGEESVLVPVQSVFLFTNLDEMDLYAGHGSTGLASGNTLAEAKLSALMELVERDGEATQVFHHTLCFQVRAQATQVADLMSDLRVRGIQFQFQDISPPYGIPCCKCFVRDIDGGIAKGTAASLSGQRAILSALTETPYPYPYGPPSGPGMQQLPLLDFEDLPDYASGNAVRDLALVEALLMANGVTPIYVDLTRSDLQIPVVRALLPGFALTADLEPDAPVHPRLFGNYLKICSHL